MIKRKEGHNRSPEAIAFLQAIVELSRQHGMLLTLIESHFVVGRDTAFRDGERRSAEEDIMDAEEYVE